MVNILVAFVTGLTTGGLSCLAVQGGLLASSLAGQIEQDMQTAPARNNASKRKIRSRASREHAANRSKLAQPIAAFLVAKLLAYTLLGALLGLVGQMFQLSPYARAALQIGIGIFMLGTGLRMLNVHPIFRYFAFEPPAFLRRKLRRTAAEADGSSLSTPILLGILTVLIPCGITQAMMAAALTTSGPLEGAALMFAFTLGTSPVFFAVAYFATQLGKRLEKNFMRFVAVVVLVLAVVTINTGLTLAGSPVSLARLSGGLFGQAGVAEAAPSSAALEALGPASGESDAVPSAAGASDGSVVTINVQNSGYEPYEVHAKAGVPVKLRLVSKDVRSCSLAFMIPKLGVQMLLEPTGETVIDIPAQEPGTSMSYSCSMGMYGGIIYFDL